MLLINKDKNNLENIKQLEQKLNFKLNTCLGIYICYVDMRHLRTPLRAYRNKMELMNGQDKKQPHFLKLTSIEIIYLRKEWQCEVYPIYGLQWSSKCYPFDEYMTYFFNKKREQDILGFRLHCQDGATNSIIVIKFEAQGFITPISIKIINVGLFVFKKV
jgi:hypothetical protein